MVFRLDNETWDEVAIRVARAEEPLVVAWFAMRDFDGNWQVPSITVRSGILSLGQVHEYRLAAIGVDVVSADEAARRLRSFDLLDGALGEAVGRIEQKQSTYQPLWLTTEGGSYPYPPTDWPRYYLNVRPGGPERGAPYSPHDELVAPGRPFFASGFAAIAEVLFGMPPARIGSDLRQGVTIILADHRARLGSIDFQGTSTLVPVEEGRPGGLRDMTLRTAWRESESQPSWLRDDVEVSEPGVVRVRTGKVPAEMRILLCDATGSAIDRRYWTPEHGERPSEPRSQEDEVARVRRLVQEGENRRVEFKASLQSQSARRAAAETIAAFANSSGGTLLVGIDDKTRAVVGYQPASAEAEQQIAEAVHQLIDGAPAFDVTRVTLPEGAVYSVEVAPQSENGPFVCKGRILVRVENTNQPATRAEIERLGPQQARTFRRGLPF